MGRRRRRAPVPSSSTGDMFTYGDALEPYAEASLGAPGLVLLKAELIEQSPGFVEPDVQPSCFEIRIRLRPERRRRVWRIEDGILNRERNARGSKPGTVPSGQNHRGFPGRHRDQPRYLRPRGSAASVPERGPDTSVSTFSDRSAPPTHLGRREHSVLKPEVTARRGRGSWAFKGPRNSPASFSPTASSHYQGAQSVVPRAHTYTHTYEYSHAQPGEQGESTWKTTGVPWTSKADELRAYGATSGLYGTDLAAMVETPVSSSGLYGKELTALAESPVAKSASAGEGEGGEGGPRAGAGERAGDTSDEAENRDDEDQSVGKREGYAVGRLRSLRAHRIQPLWAPLVSSPPTEDVPGPFLGAKHLHRSERGPAVSPVGMGEGLTGGGGGGGMSKLAAEEEGHGPTKAVSGTVSDVGTGTRAWTWAGAGGRARARKEAALPARPYALPLPSSTAPVTPESVNAPGGSVPAPAPFGKGHAVDSLVGKMLVHQDDATKAPKSLPRSHTTAADTMVGMFGSLTPPVTSHKKQVTSHKPDVVQVENRERKGPWRDTREHSRSARSQSVAALLQERLARVEENDRRLGLRGNSPGPLDLSGREVSAPSKPGEGMSTAGVPLTPSSIGHSGGIPATPSVAGSRAGPYISLQARTSAEKVMSWQDAFHPGPGRG